MELELDALDLRYERLRRRDPKRERRLLSSLAEVGQQFPILVVRGLSAEQAGESAPGQTHLGSEIVVDGYKRVRALVKLGRETVQATRWELEEPDAVMLESLMRAAGSEGPLIEAWRLAELRDRFHLSTEELARRFDRSGSWVSRRLALVKALPEEVGELVRKGAIVAYAAMRFLVPLARANRTDCLRLSRNVAGLELSTRQFRDLYAAYLEASPVTRERLLENPALFLKALTETKDSPPEPGPARILLNDMEIMGGVARRVLRKIRDGLARRVLHEERAEILRSLAQAERDFEEMGQRLRKEYSDVGSSDASRDSQAP